MNASNQTVGQSLTLQCEVTTVKGITSRVDIVWSSDGTELGRTNNVSTKMDNSLVYTDSYTISQLSTTDDGGVIQCEVVINTSPLVTANDNITLNVIGKYYPLHNHDPINIILYIVPTPTITISPSHPIQGAIVGSPQLINCTVSTVSGVEFSSVMISWMGPRGNIESDATNDRVSIRTVNAGGSNMYISNVQFTYLMEGDEGNYTCNVMILETITLQSVELQSLTSKLCIT